MKKCLLCLVVAGLLLVTSGAIRAADSDGGKQKPAELDRPIRVTMKYLIYLPQDYDQKQ